MAPANEQQPQLVLIGLPHLTLDPQHSRGGTTTFTERWGDFLAGSGPPPAPAPAHHTSYCRTGAQAAMPGPSGQLGTAGSSLAGHSQGGNSEQHCRNSFSPLLQPLLQQQTQGRAGCCSGSGSGNGSRHAHQAAPCLMGISTADGLQGLSRQVNRQFFPLLLGQHAAVGHRPGSPELLPTSKVSRQGRACCPRLGSAAAFIRDVPFCCFGWGQHLLVSLAGTACNLACVQHVFTGILLSCCCPSHIRSCCCAGRSMPIICTKSSTSCVIASTHAPSYSQSWQDEDQGPWRQQQQQCRRRPS